MKTQISVSMKRWNDTYGTVLIGQEGRITEILSAVAKCVEVSAAMTANDGYARDVLIRVEEAKEPEPAATAAEEIAPA